MDPYASEQEQVDQLKRWWKENGKSLVLGLVIGIGGLGGYRWWDMNQTRRAEAASLSYELFLQRAQEKQLDDARQVGRSIVENYADSTYARLTSLMLAKLAYDTGDADEAKSLLRGLVDDGAVSQISAVARARLARILLAEGNTAEAAALLEPIPEVDNNPRFAELRGDVLLANGDTDAARVMYLKALAQAESLGLERGAIQLKLDNLAASGSGS